MKIGLAVTASYCTFREVLDAVKPLSQKGYNFTPIISETAYQTDTKFGGAAEFVREFEDISCIDAIHTIVGAEPIGPKKMFDLLVVAPCTSNTLAKLAYGINDTCVTMAVKSHLRNGGPVLLAISTNDALAGSAKNIGQLLNYKNIYFVPYAHDNSEAKPNSLIADFSLLEEAMSSALKGKQLYPLVLGEREHL